MAEFDNQLIPASEPRSVRLETYSDVAAALANTDLSRSLDRERYERGNILEGVVMMLDGPEHRERRRVESMLFRRDVLWYYEHDLFPQTIHESLATIIASGEANLVAIGALLAVVLSARTAGIDYDVNSLTEREELSRLVDVFALGISIDARLGDIDDIRATCQSGLSEFSLKYLQASLAKRREVLAGEGSYHEPPVDLIATLLEHKEELGVDDDQFLRETAFFLEAGAHTTSQTLATTMHFIFGWLADHPTDRARLRADTYLIQRFVHEALRLRPTNPRIRRRAMVNTVVAGRAIPQGTIVELDTAAANRDRSVFGADASDFDPFREIPASITRWGHSFGGGAHACIGRNLAVGTPTRFDRQPGGHHMVGTVALIIQALLRLGAYPHPELQPTPDESTHRWTQWAHYPIMFQVPAT